MKRRLGWVMGLLVLGGVTATAQRPRADVQVTRSATLRTAIASDTMEVFDFLSNSQKLASWFPDQAIMEPHFGGRYHFRWEGASGVWSGVVTQFIRGNTLAYTWQAPGEPYETNVQFKLFPQGAETLVELTHRGFTSAAAEEKSIKAWTFYLQNLKSVIEEETDLRTQGRRSSRSLQP